MVTPNKSAKEDLSKSLLSKCDNMIYEGIQKGDINALIRVKKDLGEALSSAWRRSWRDGTSWKEHNWKNGTCGINEKINPADVVINPLKSQITETTKKIDARRR